MSNIEVELGDIVRSLKKLEAQINLKGEGIVRLRFEQGCLLKDVVGATKYGDGAVERIAGETGINESTLRIAYGLAKFFHFRETSLDKKIKELKEAGKSISYNYFRAMLQENRNPELHGSPEKHKDHLLKKVESAGQALREASDQYPNDDEVRGTAVAFVEVIEETDFDLIGDRGTSGVRKGRRWQCEEYLRYVREHKCCVSKQYPVEAHHLIYRSRGGQASDLFAVPLSRELHQEYHSIGHSAFVEKYNIDFNAIVTQLIEGFITQLLK